MNASLALLLAAVVLLSSRGDGNAQEVIETILVGTSPIASVCGKNCRHVYVADQKGRSIVVVDTATRREIDSIPLRDVPMDLAFDSTRDRLYVLNRGGGGLSMIDLTTKQEKAPLASHVGMTTTSLAISAAKAYVGYYTKQLRGYIDVIDLTRQIVTKTLSYSNVAYNNLGCPMGSAVSADGKLLYVSVQCVGAFGRQGHDPIWIYSTSRDLPVGAIYFGDRPNVGSGLVARPGTAEIWAGGGNPCSAPLDHNYDRVGCDGTGRDPISVIDTARNEVRQHFLAASHVVGFTPDGKRAFINAGTSLLVADTAQLGVRSVALRPAGGRIAVTADGNHAYVPVRVSEAAGETGAVVVLRLAQ